MGLWDVEVPTSSLDSRLTDGDKFVSLKHRLRFTPQENDLINSWYPLQTVQ
jgi:hypothetical protein